MVGHGAERVTKKLQEDGPSSRSTSSSSTCSAAPATPSSVGLTAFPDDDLDEDRRRARAARATRRCCGPRTIAALVAAHRHSDAACTVLTAGIADPTGYGRVVRGKDDRVARIVEQADATDEEREIDEVNTVDLLLPAAACWPRRCAG